MMALPGGHWNGDRRCRDFSFRPLDGGVELAVAEAARARHRSKPDRVTAVLSAALEAIGDYPADDDLIDALSVADRQYLMGVLGDRLGFPRIWITTACANCAAPFEFAFAPGDVPAREAGGGYPFIDAQTSLGCLRFRVPDGAAQKAVAGISDAAAALRGLLAACADRGTDIAALSDADIGRVDKAMEAVAPELADEAEAACPACDEPCAIPLDTSLWLSLNESAILNDVHTLAIAYHWSETAILALPRHRRLQYLAKVERERGMVHGGRAQ